MSIACDCGAVSDGMWADIHSPYCAIFRCSVCGGQAFVSPLGDEAAFCPEHCPDHEYEYEPGVGKRCKTCFAEPPHDYYEEC